jgi:polar amino acid transport system substrate-binding protein
MKRSTSRRIGRLAALGVALCSAVALAACGSSGGKSAAGSNSNAATGSSANVAVDQTLAGKVPAKYKSGFTVAMQSSQPPEAYLENGQAVGISPDLVRAISKVIGVPIKIDSTTFENELLGVSAGRYGFVTDTNVTATREKKYDQFAYYITEYRFVRLSSSPSLGNSFSDLCGKTIGNQVGDVSVPIIEQYSKTYCTDKGKKAITQVQQPSQSSALLAMRSGRVDAVARPLDSAVYAAKQPGGAGTTIDGPDFLKGLVGASFPKGSELAPVIISAMAELVKNGTYQQIMQKHGYDSSVQVTSFKLNPTPLPGS